MRAKRKTSMISFKVTPDEKVLIETGATRSGLSVTAFLILCARNFVDGIKFEQKEGER